MKKQNILKTLALLLSLVVVFTVTTQTTYAYYVTKSETVVNTFRPIEIGEYDLMLTKTIEHPLGADYRYPADLSFTFEVDFGTDYANSDFTVVSGMQDAVQMNVDETGKAKVQVTPNVPLYIKGILDGTEVTVTELLSDEMVGFTAKDNVLTQTATIAEGGVQLDFVNVYKPEPVFDEDVTISGSKQLQGREWKDGDVFEFHLEMQEDNGAWTLIDSAKVSYNQNDKDFAQFTFDKWEDIEFDEVGTYHLRVTEVAGSEEGMTYDLYDRAFDVKVTDADMNGYLEIAEITAGTNVIVTEGSESGIFALEMKFTNIYEAETPEEPEEPEEPDKPVSPGISPPTGDDRMPTVIVIVVVLVAWRLVRVIINRVVDKNK